MSQFSEAQILDNEPLHAPPHQCAVTGRNDGRVLDTGCTIPGFDPRLYLKVEVIEEMGKLVGMVPREDYEALQERVNELKAKYDEFAKQLEAYRNIEEGLKTLEVAA